MSPIESEHYRHVLSHLPTSVVLVTGEHEGSPAGLAVGSFVSISLRPPLVGFFCDRGSTSWPQIRRSGHFCVNVLAHDQAELALRFARSGGPKFDGLAHVPAAHTGSPLLPGVLAWIDCEVASETEVGDHTFVVGQALGMAVDRADPPLVFHRGAFPGLAVG